MLRTIIGLFALALFLDASVAEARFCAPHQLKVSAGKQMFYSKTSAQTKLDRGWVMFQEEDKDEFSLFGISGDSALNCLAGPNPRVGMKGRFGLEKSKGSIHSNLLNKDVEVDSFAIFAGPLACLLLPSDFSVCGGALVKNIHLDMLGFEMSMGSVAPVFILDKSVSGVLFSLEASQAKYGIKHDNTELNLRAVNYSIGLGYLF